MTPWQRDQIVKYSIITMMVVCVILGAITAFLFISSRPSYASEPFLYNAFLTDKLEDGSFRYYNGNNFFRYDTKSHTMTQLTPSATAPINNVRDILWLKDGALFSVSSIATWDALASNYDQYAIDVGDDFAPVVQSDVIWHISFATGEVKPITQSVVSLDTSSVQNSDGKGVVFVDGEVLSEITTDGTITREVVSPKRTIGSHVQPVYANSSIIKYLIVDDTSVKLVSYARNDKKEAAIADTLSVSPKVFTSPVIALDADHFVYYDQAKDSDQKELVIYNVKSKQRQVMINNFAGSFSKTGVIYTGTSKLIIYSLDLTGINKLFTVDNPIARPRSVSCIDTSCIFDGNGRIWFVSDHKDTTESFKPAYHDALENVVSGDDYDLTRNINGFSDNDYTVTFLRGTVPSMYQKVRSDIKAKGHNPDQFVIMMNPGRDVNY